MIEDWPTAMLAKGPACTKQGLYSAVHMRVGLIVLRMKAAIALPTSRSPVVTGLPLLSKATVILFRRFFRSARSLATERIAMHSEPTAIPNFDCIIKPSVLPPMPMIILRRLWAQKSIIHPISTRVGSMSSRLILVRRFNCSSL